VSGLGWDCILLARVVASTSFLAATSDVRLYRHIGMGGALVLLILSFIFRNNLFTLLGGGTGDSGSGGQPAGPCSRCGWEATRTIRVVRTRRYAEDLGKFCPSILIPRIDTPSWCFSAITLSPDAAAQRRPRVHSSISASLTCLQTQPKMSAEWSTPSL
jgi:hypothetical protein